MKDDLLFHLRRPWVLTLALTVFAVAPLFYPGYFLTHGGFIPLYNLGALKAEGVLFPLAWSPSIGTQFDPFRSDGLLTYCIGAKLLALGTTPGLAAKLVMGLGILLGAAGTYLLARRALESGAGALLAALLYVYAPYNLAVTYVRGAWGETLAVGLLPWGLLAFEAGYSPDRAGISKYARAVLGPFAAWLLIGMGNLGLGAAFLVFGFAWLGALSAWRGLESAPWPETASAMGGLALAAAITWPQGASHEPPVVFSGHFLYPAQLLSAFWGFGGSRAGWADGFGFGLGAAPILLAMATLFSWRARPPRGRLRHTLMFSLWAAVLVTALLGTRAAPVWRLTYTDRLLTYPWQVIPLIALSLAMLGGAAARLCHEEDKEDEESGGLNAPLYAAFLLVVLLGSYACLEPRYTRFEPGDAPAASLDGNRVLLVDVDVRAAIPGAVAGLPGLVEVYVPTEYLPPPRPGDTLQLELVWQAGLPIDENYKVFVHLRDAGGNTLVQVDAYPLEGEHPTYEWTPGELVRDVYRLRIPPDAPEGPYRLAVGLYDEATMQRLEVAGSDRGEVMLDVDR